VTMILVTLDAMDDTDSPALLPYADEFGWILDQRACVPVAPPRFAVWIKEDDDEASLFS